MTKSYVSFFSGLYDAIFADCVCQYPGLSVELGRDQKRLKTASEKRGDHVFTIDLPAIGKEFETNLSSRFIRTVIKRIPKRNTDCHVLSEPVMYEEFADVLPLHGRRTGSPIPRLFGGLWLLVFDSDGLLLDDPDVNAIFFLRQFYYAVKKVELQCPSAAVFAAVEDFVKIEEAMRHPTNDWLGDCMEPSKQVHLHDDIATVVPSLPLFGGGGKLHNLSSEAIESLSAIQLIADMAISQFGDFNPNDWSFKHGPGAVADAKKGNKYEFPTWPRKLEQTFASDIFAFANYSDWAEFANSDNQEGRFSLNESPSKLISVPKTQKGPRLIAAEPTCHQWCQQSLKSFLEAGVANTFLRSAISFADQNESRTAALTASRTGWNATIDLSSASDRLSLWTVERVFRGNSPLLRALHSARTRWLINGIDKKQPKFIKLRKFASQGAAVTFPVQTIVYALISIGCVLTATPGFGRKMLSRDAIENAAREVRVFGDDIIVPVHVTGRLIEVLQYLGLRVNMSKSFMEGNFRESCGMDAYAGQDVTPAYLRHIGSPTQPESICSLVACSNNFQRKGLFHAAEFIQKHTTSIFNLKIPVVGIDSGLFGWASFCGSDTKGLKARWNHHLQREEHQIHLPFGKVARGVQSWQTTLLQYFTENRPTTSHWTDHLRDPKNWAAGWIAGVTVKIRLRWTLVA
jgi:hypothetical protein